MDFDPHPYYQPRNRGPWIHVIIVLLGLAGLIAWVMIMEHRNSNRQLPEGPGTLEYIVTLDSGQARIKYPAIANAPGIIVSETWFKTYQGTTARGQYLVVEGLEPESRQVLTCEIRFHEQTVVKNRGIGHVNCEVPSK